MILLDTHIWFWWINQDTHRFPETWNMLIKQADTVLVSPVSCFEIALAYKKGRIALPCEPEQWLSQALNPAGIALAPLTASIATSAVGLTEAHKDPFDRIIIATALTYQATLLSIDTQFKNYAEIEHLLANSNMQ